MTAPAAAARRRPLPVPAVPVLGLLGVVAVTLLLFGPFHGARYESPAHYLQRWLAAPVGAFADLTGLRAAQRLATWVIYDFTALLLVVLVAVMVVLPTLVVIVRRTRERGGEPGATPHGEPGATPHGDPGTGSHGEPGTGRARGTAPRTSAPRRDRRSSLVFSDDGSVGEVGAEPGEDLERGLGELRALAAEAGLPWHARYETEGGARALLEVLRARGERPATFRRAEELAPRREPAHETTAQAEPATHPATDPATEPVRSPDRFEPVPTVLVDDEDGDRSPWTSGGVGSVYTSTTLYSSDRSEDASPRPASEDEQEEGR